MTELSAETVREFLDYDPATGQLTWKPRQRRWFPDNRSWNSWNAKYAGKKIGCLDGNGYLRAGIFGERYKAHRLIWLMVHDHWPEFEIDHINGNRTDNRFCNLRSVTRRENTKNRMIRCDNLSGIVGVSFDCPTGKWVSRICVDGKNIYLGLFESRRRAAKVRKQAEKKYGFHKNHGRAEAGL